MIQFIWGAKPAQIRNQLLMLALSIGIMSIITEYLVEVEFAFSSNAFLIDVLNLFSVNLEESIPTWFATTLLFVSAGLLSFIALAKFYETDRYRWHWVGLAIGFLYLSIDEGAGIHEIFVDPMKRAFNPDGFFAFGWQIVAIPVVLVVFLLYLRFMMHLPMRTRLWLIASAGFYLGGALIVEGISASLWDSNNGISMPYLAIATIEELFEMIGVVCFIYTLLDLMEQGNYAFTLHHNPLLDSAQKMQPPQRFPLLIPLLVIVNGILLGWMILTPQPVIPSDTDTGIAVEVPFYYGVQDQILADQGVIVEMQGIFGIDNPFSRQMGAMLLDQYRHVIAITQPTRQLTTMIATNALFITRDDITTLLHNIGQTNFIIFETDTVRTISQLSQ